MSRKNDSTIDDDDDDKNITRLGLTKTEWKLHRTSLLLNRDNDDAAVRTAQIILKTLPKNVKTCQVKFTRCPAIQLTDRSPPALLVEVFFSDERVFIGYFINWSLWTEKYDDSCDNLPMYLFSAKSQIAQTVNEVLVRVLDFVMAPVELNPMQLIGLLTIFLRCSEEHKDRCAVFKYTIPNMFKGLISLSNNVNTLLDLLKLSSMESEEGDDVNMVFYEKLLRHLKLSHQLELGHAVLDQVSLPEAKATRNGLAFTAGFTNIWAIMPRSINDFPNTCLNGLPPLGLLLGLKEISPVGLKGV